MNQIQSAPLPPIPTVSDLTFADLGRALSAGWRDFLAQPLFGLFFASFYVLGGLVLAWLLVARGESGWLVVAASGFPLLAPFTAVGLYEVSRRRELGLPMSWRAVLGALRGCGDDQLILIGGFVFVGFTFWMILAHGIFAIFMAGNEAGSHSLAALTSTAGLAMLGLGSIVGAVLSFLFYAITVISLPLLLEHDRDFLTAIFASVRSVQRNFAVMLGWAVICAAALFLAMLPGFLGLFAALPVLAHATWHLYRRVIG